MGENRSLDDFFTTSEDSGADTDADSSADTNPDDSTITNAGSESAEPTDSVNNTSDVTGSLTVYRFSPEPTECPGCGVSVTALWRDGDRYVCRSCKDW